MKRMARIMQRRMQRMNKKTSRKGEMLLKRIKILQKTHTNLCLMKNLRLKRVLT